jgi:hypothetical protein
VRRELLRDPAEDRAHVILVEAVAFGGAVVRSFVVLSMHALG